MEIQPSRQTSFASDTSADAEGGSAGATDPDTGQESCWSSWPCLAVLIIPNAIFAASFLAAIRATNSLTYRVLLGIAGGYFVVNVLLLLFLILKRFWRSCSSESIDSETGQIS